MMNLPREERYPHQKKGSLIFLWLSS
jgi:hypothetical protein